MRTTIFSWMIFILIKGSHAARIVRQKEQEGVARVETGALGRLVYGIISTLCLCALSFALGLRVKQFKRKERFPFAWILCHVQTVVAMMLVISGAILVYGLNLTTWKQCRASITVCLFLYFFSKVLLYIFYLERIHIARQPLVRRCDRIWIGGMIMTVGFFGGMAIWCLATPHSAISVHDGHCRIGSDMIPSYTTFSTDIVINFSLTGVFIWLILPILKNQARGPTTILNEFSRPPALDQFGLRGVLRSNAERDDPLASSVKKMLRRNIIGSVLTFAAGAINLIVYFVDATSQIAFVCYTMCIIDVVFGVLVVQWLTFGSYEPDLAFNQPFGLANVANSQIAYAADHSMPERINIPNQKSGMESRCAMNFITMAEDPET